MQSSFLLHSLGEDMDNVLLHNACHVCNAYVLTGLLLKVGSADLPNAVGTDMSSPITLYSDMQDLLLTEPDLAAGFQHTQFLVMDEADRLLESSFESDLRAILTQLPARRQTLLFSATMTKNLVALQKAVLHDAFHFQVTLL